MTNDKERAPNFLSSFTDEINFIFHDRYMKILLFIIPLFLIVFVCTMFSNGVPERIPVAAVDYDHSSLSRSIVSNIEASRSIKLVAMPENVELAQHLMRKMKIFAFIEIPRGAAASALRSDNNPLAIRYNAQFRSTGNAAFQGLQSAANDALQSLKTRALVGVENKSSSSGDMNIQIMNISNAQNSYERFLTPIAIPVLLMIVLSSAVICAIGRFFQKKGPHLQINKSRAYILSTLIARSLPYVVIIFLWNLLFHIWQAAIRGWPILGSPWVLILAILVLCILTACIAVMFILLTRNTLKALSISTIYTSAALTYSDGTLSILNANAWAHFWSNFQPFTHYYRIQLEQINLGSDVATSLHQFGILSLYIIIPSLIIFLLAGKSTLKIPPEEAPESIDFNGFKQSVINTLKSIKKCEPIFSTAVVSLIIYSLFYPSAYRAQVNLKLPVIVVDLDQSSLSASLIKNLDSTREMDVVQVSQSEKEALNALRNRQADGVIIIDNDFKNKMVRGGNAGINIHLSGGYMAVAADLRQAISGAITATTDINRRASSTHQTIASLPLYNVTQGYETFVMPLVFIIILQQTLIFSSAMLVALRKSYGLFKLSLSQFTGTFAALFMIGLFGAIFIFGWVYYLKGYPNQGNIWLQLYLIIIFATAVSSLGMLIGSLFDNINRPMQLLSSTSMVIFYASGASFPAFNMPDWVIYTMAIFPSTTMINGFTMLNSQGANLHELMPVVLKITLLATLLFLLALYRFVGHAPSADKGVVRTKGAVE